MKIVKDNKKLLEKFQYNVKKLCSDSYSYKTSTLFSKLSDSTQCETGIYGGAVRDWFLDKQPKDIDIVTYCTQEYFDSLVSGISTTKTNLGGYKFILNGVDFDLWRMQDSYPLTQNPELPVNFESLVATPLFNTDGIIITLNNQIYEHRFWESMESGSVDLINTCSVLNEKYIALRALKFLNKYKFKPTQKLADFIVKINKECGGTLLDFAKEGDWKDAILSDGLKTVFNYSSDKNKSSSNSLDWKKYLKEIEEVKQKAKNGINVTSKTLFDLQKYATLLEEEQQLKNMTISCSKISSNELPF